MAQHAMGSVRQGAHGQSQSRWGCSAEKSTVPSSANPRQIYATASHPPGQSYPMGTGLRRGLGAKKGTWHHGHATQPVPRRSRPCQVPAATLAPWHLRGTWKLAPLTSSWPCVWLCAHDPCVEPCLPAPGVGAQVCPGSTRAGKQMAWLAIRGHGQQHPWGGCLAGW